MKIRVGINKLETLEEDKLNKGEYNIHECTFEFDDVYNDLIKKAVFSKDDHNYLVDIENDSVIVPYEMFENNNDFSIGVYGYAVEDEELVLRYSPSPVYMQVSEGSYKDKIDNYNIPTADIVEQLEEEIQGLKGIVLYDNPEGTQTSFDISDAVGNYNYIEVFYKSRHGQETSRKGLVEHLPSISSFSSYLEVMLKDGDYLTIDGCNIFIDGTSATFRGNEAKRITLGQDYIGVSDTQIILYKVIGYKN